MILRTDTIGKIKDPNENDIGRAVCYADGEMARVGDIVNLMTDAEYEGDFVSLYLNTKEVGHTLNIRIGGSKMECSRRFDNETAISNLIMYAKGDLSWIHDLEWKEPISSVLIRNILNLAK
jgi:hypothetical protein